MPMPKPNSGESKEDFIQRFMSNEAMVSEYPDESQRRAVAESSWEKKEFAMETVDLKHVPIFSTGIWEGNGSPPGGDRIDNLFLKSIVDTFKNIGNKVKPRMFISHNKDISRSRTGMPSVGWITNLETDGNILYGDLKSVPKKVAQLIEKKAFGRFSPGIWRKMNVNGADYENVLEHVALLGAELPANMDLDGFIDLYYTTNNENIEGNDFRQYTEKIISEDNIMEERIKELEKSLTEKNEIIKTLESEKVELTKQCENLKADYSKLETEVEGERTERKRVEVDNYLSQAVEDGKITPAQKQEFAALMMNDTSVNYTYIEDNKTMEISGGISDVVKRIIDNAGEPVDFTQRSHHVEVEHNKQSESDVDEESVEFDKKITGLMKEQPDLSYREAAEIVANEGGE